MPEQLGSYNDVVAGPACELLVLLSLWVAFVVLDEVDDGGAPVSVESQNLLPYGRDQVGLGGRFLFHLDCRAVECLNEHAGGTMDRLDPSWTECQLPHCHPWGHGGTPGHIIWLQAF